MGAGRLLQQVSLGKRTHDEKHGYVLACCGLLARGGSVSSGEGGHFAANASTVLGTHEGLLKGPTLLAYRGTGSCSLYLWVAAAAQATALHANATTRSLLIGPSSVTSSDQGPSPRYADCIPLSECSGALLQSQYKSVTCSK